MLVYAATTGALDEFAVEDAKRFVVGLGEYLDTRDPEILSKIRSTGELSEETEASLKSAIESYAETFVATESGPGSETALGETTPPDEVKPDVGWDRMSSADDDDDETS